MGIALKETVVLRWWKIDNLNNLIDNLVDNLNFTPVDSLNNMSRHFKHWLFVGMKGQSLKCQLMFFKHSTVVNASVDKSYILIH